MSGRTALIARRLPLLLAGLLAFSGCGRSSTGGTARTPTGAEVSRRVASPTAAPAQASPSPGRTPDAEDALLEGIATQGAGRTPEPTREGVLLGQESNRFAGRVRQALLALRELPAYAYTVNDPLYAPGLTLVGRVATQREREWTVHEAGDPDHVIARWVQVGGRTYTDVSGEWARIAAPPFDPDFPLSFAPTHAEPLFDPEQGRVTDATTGDGVSGARDATVYTLQRQLAEAAYDRAQDAATHTEYLYVSPDAGHLLEYKGPSDFRNERSPQRELTVTPLDRQPEIAAPAVGRPAFRGAPPVWRAVVLGEARLAGVDRFRFTSVAESFGIRSTARGQVSASEGGLEGGIPDQYWEGGAEPDARPPLVRLSLVYEGAKAWARAADRPWRAANVDVTGDEAPDFNALLLLALAPVSPPDRLVGSRRAFEEGLGGVTFGTYAQQGASVFSGGELVGAETVNGVRAYHYRGGLNGGTLPSGKPLAEVWLAADGLHVVRARYSFASSPYAPPGAREERAVDVFDIGEPFTVDPPRVPEGPVSRIDRATPDTAAASLPAHSPPS